MSGIKLLLSGCDLLEDPRVPGLISYPLKELLLCALCGILCGYKDWEEIAYWGEHQINWLRKFLPFSNGIASSQTFNRFFNALDSKAFADLFEDWISSFRLELESQHIAVDGKTVRGSKKSPDGSGAIHLISAYVSELSLVIGQEKTCEKSNEITAIPELLERLSIEGTVISMDAMGTQKDIVRKVREKKADYLLALKGNQGTLHDDVRIFFHERNKATIWDEDEETDAGHGRIEIRTCTATSDIEWLRLRHPEWKDLYSIAMIQSIRIQKKTNLQTTEERYYISSLRPNARYIQSLARAHWGIENRLHWCLDVQFREDSCRVRKEHGPINLAYMRKIAMNLLRMEPTKMPLKRKILRASLEPQYLQSLLQIKNL